MAQITLYLDDETQALLEESAKNQALSKSRWVAELIRKYARPTWPPEWYALAGSVPDCPLSGVDYDAEPSVPDAPRIDLQD